MMITGRNSIIITKGTISIITPRNDSSTDKPRPWSTHLSTITTKGHAFKTVATSSRVRNRKQVRKFTGSINAQPIIKCFSSPMCPTRPTIRLISYVSYNRSTFRPEIPRIKLFRIIPGCWIILNISMDLPIRIYNSTKHLFNSFFGHFIELGIDTRNPRTFILINLIVRRE